MKHLHKFLSFVFIMLLLISKLPAQNPLITNMYSADPSARVFGDSIYVYPSHDILATPGHGRVGWFCMQDYHVYASKNLTNWKDDGIVVSQTTVPWAKPDGYSMWAPDCIERNGKYYFYFPTAPDSIYGRGFAIGVAIADKPSGPFIPEKEPIKGVHGIDPNVFIDKDGQAYLYYALGNIYGVKLKSNMLELDGKPEIIQGLPTDKGLKEGPFLFERNGKYYMTYPHVADKTEQLEYAVGDSPLGPFKVTGVIMDESPHCWTNHQSVVQYNNQWYLFYHSNDLSPNFDKARSIRADSLFFNADGTIKKVIPTFRGIGITNATSTIQIDRYSAIAHDGVRVDFIDTTNRFEGWKTIFNKPNAWIKYNTVDFGNQKLHAVVVKAISSTGGTLQIHLDKIQGPLIAQIKVPQTDEWKEIKTPLSSLKTGVHHLVVSLKTNSIVEVDWIKFE
jgi:arabinoxylan arabinofuranohydrolase